MVSPLAGPRRVDEAGSADTGHDGPWEGRERKPASRLRSANDAVLLSVLVVPQLLWLVVVIYLLHRHA